MDEHQQPARGAAALGQIPPCAAPEIEEPFLHRILGQIVVAQDAPGERKRGRAEPVVELGKRGLVAARGQRHEGFLGEVGEITGHEAHSDMGARITFAARGRTVRSIVLSR